MIETVLTLQDKDYRIRPFKRTGRLENVEMAVRGGGGGGPGGAC